eukprot:scaffold1990_cov115-Skeletonema_dohrnii-CCMP3373.AAC.7
MKGISAGYNASRPGHIARPPFHPTSSEGEKKEVRWPSAAVGHSYWVDMRKQVPRLIQNCGLCDQRGVPTGKGPYASK